MPFIEFTDKIGALGHSRQFHNLSPIHTCCKKKKNGLVLVGLPGFRLGGQIDQLKTSLFWFVFCFVFFK